MLHIACRRKEFESAKLFVEHSADVDAKNVSVKLQIYSLFEVKNEGHVRLYIPLRAR